MLNLALTNFKVEEAFKHKVSTPLTAKLSDKTWVEEAFKQKVFTPLKILEGIYDRIEKVFRKIKK